MHACLCRILLKHAERKKIKMNHVLKQYVVDRSLKPFKKIFFENDLEKSEALDHSKRLDVHRWSDHPEVNDFVGEIYDTYFRKGNPRIQRRHIKLVLLDLFVRWSEDPALKISFSRNHNDYYAKGFYNELYISRLTIDVVDRLEEVGLINQVKGFHDHDDDKECGRGPGRLARIWATEDLIRLFKKARFSSLDAWPHKDRLTVVLNKIDPKDEKEKKKIEVSYDPTQETKQMSEMLRKYNGLIRHTFIDIPTLESAVVNEGEGGKRKKLVISQNGKFTRRVFNRGAFDCGGRFWGGWWQRCERGLRPKIFMNDKPTNEIDFSGLHIVMLYAEEGIDYWAEVGTDPYKIPTPNFLDDEKHARGVAKVLMLNLLNAKNAKSAYQAFRNRAEKGSREKALKNDELSVVHKLLAQKHPLIAPQFGEDAGIRLMNKDSKITEYILETFTEQSVPVLSVHDSYIIEAGKEDMLIEAMCDGFELVMGVSIAPNKEKAMKEKSERIGDLLNALRRTLNDKGSEAHQKNVSALRERCRPDQSQRYKTDWERFQSWLKYQ